MKLGEIVRRLESQVIHPIAAENVADREPLGYSIDSRTLRKGELFFAIRGETHDGHRFVADALEKGAMAVVVSAEFLSSPDAGALSMNRAKLIPVADTLVALQLLASSVLRSWSGRVVAITGSMGKTTTKEMAAAVLARVGRVIKTEGNLNNAFGLPLSILKMESDGAHASDFDLAVLEMGMNHKGELCELTRIAPPDLGVVTNVAAVHLEAFSSIDEIAAAKSELIAGIKSGGAAVLNADDDRVMRMRTMRSDLRYHTFGIDRAADVAAREVRAEGLERTSFVLATRAGEAKVSLPLAGRHNVYNALAAAAIGDFCGASPEAIASALALSSSPKMRGQVYRLGGGITLVDDSYNSNPSALLEMVATVCANRDYKRRVVVAGEMLELGSTAPELHREAGRRIVALGAGVLIGVRGFALEIVAGAREAGMSEDAALFCDSPETAAELVERIALPGDVILVKGSRGVKTEIIVERLKREMAG
ncbi:MAG TPA: UDP-N-acetylmuramoyl-tripeptide--D-alanyl-D-alanine ligase [Blastocatellia bacterium]|nr:UDP-N-acetylmuramoyl-tripeptide--D-alanyl-D-alanine ligase [Blastocatellia bacterium]